MRRGLDRQGAWECKDKHFTRDFEGFALTLMREMPLKRAGEILGEGDTRPWRMLFLHVKAAHAALDLSELVHLGVDEMNLRKVTRVSDCVRGLGGPPGGVRH